MGREKRVREEFFWELYGVGIWESLGVKGLHERRKKDF